MELWLIVVAIVGGLAILYGLAVLAGAWYFARQLARPRMVSPEETLAATYESGEAAPELVARFSESFRVATADGAEVAGVCLAGSDAPGGGQALRTVILLHGITWTWHGMLKYLPPFLDGGWNIVMYDSRGHGANPRQPPGFGVREVDDLVRVAAWARARFPAARIVGAWGESMGGAVLLQALGAGLELDFAIDDCSFADLGAVCRNELRRSHVPAFLAPPILARARVLVRRMAGFDFEAVSPRLGASRSRVPLLILHGEEDGLAPVSHARAIAAACPPGVCRLEIFPGARHAKSWAEDPERYFGAVREFLAAHAALPRESGRPA